MLHLQQAIKLFNRRAQPILRHFGRPAHPPRATCPIGPTRQFCSAGKRLSSLKPILLVSGRVVPILLHAGRLDRPPLAAFRRPDHPRYATSLVSGLVWPVLQHPVPRQGDFAAVRSSKAPVWPARRPTQVSFCCILWPPHPTQGDFGSPCVPRHPFGCNFGSPSSHTLGLQVAPRELQVVQVLGAARLAALGSVVRRHAVVASRELPPEPFTRRGGVREAVRRRGRQQELRKVALLQGAWDAVLRQGPGKLWGVCDGGTADRLGGRLVLQQQMHRSWRELVQRNLSRSPSIRPECLLSFLVSLNASI